MSLGVPIVVVSLGIGALAGEGTGPWDLAELRRVPQAEWVGKEGSPRALYYANEPFGGKPTRVFACYAVPEKREGKVPAMLLVHGGGGKAFPHWAEAWAKRGYAALAMDLNGCAPDGKRLPDGGPSLDHQWIFQAMAKGIAENWVYHAVAAVIRGVSLLAAQPEVDPERIGITGISWGGYLACIVAGLDERLKLAVPVYACGFLHENSCWLPELAKLSEGDRRLWVESFDPSRYLAQARMPMLWVNGTNDFAYPLDSYQKSYRLPKGPRTLCVTVGMGHGHEAGWAPLEIGIFADQHLRGGMPLAEIGPMRVKGSHVEASFRTRSPVLRGGLHYTTGTAAWDQRKWRTVPGEMARGRVRATLPDARPIAFFVTITDSRGATVSTEHRELQAP